MSGDTPNNQGKAITMPYTYTLKYPIQAGSETITEMVFTRRLVAKDLKGLPAQGMTMDHITLLLARVLGKTSAIIELVDAADLVELAEVINSFLPSGRATGEN